MNINTSLVKFTKKASNKKSMKSTSFQDKTSGKLTLKEMKEKEYPFPDSDVTTITINIIDL